jgi:hypothetical protein
MKMYNENYVNCWKATVILITMLISIQAITGVIEGSTTRPYALEQSMKAHERIASHVDDDIVWACMKIQERTIKCGTLGITPITPMNTSATGGYVSTDFELMGFTGNEKTISRIGETYEKEAKFPRVVVFEKTLRKGMNVVFDLSNYNEDLIPVFTQGTKIDLGTGTGTQISHGTSEPVKEYRTIRFAAQLEDNTHYIIDLPKCSVTIGESTIGGESESVLPLTVKAVYNANTNATGSLYIEKFLASTLNATALPPPGF